MWAVCLVPAASHPLEPTPGAGALRSAHHRLPLHPPHRLTQAATDGLKLEDVPVIGLEPLERPLCDRCATNLVDLHRHCPDCGWDYCVGCCSELRAGAAANGGACASKLTCANPLCGSLGLGRAAALRQHLPADVVERLPAAVVKEEEAPAPQANGETQPHEEGARAAAAAAAAEEAAQQEERGAVDARGGRPARQTAINRKITYLNGNDIDGDDEGSGEDEEADEGGAEHAQRASDPAMAAVCGPAGPTGSALLPLPGAAELTLQRLRSLDDLSLWREVAEVRTALF